MIDYKKYLNKTVFLKTIYGKVFTIKVEEVNETELSGIDKFNEPVDISLNDISSINVHKEVKNGYYN